MTNSIEAIERTLIIDSAQNEVWEVLTNPVKLSQWFGQSAEFKLEPGSIGSFGWDDHGTFAMRIEQVEPQDFFSWSWMSEKSTPFDQNLTTLVEWKLKSLTPNKTELYMKESGFKSPESRSDNVGGWNQELEHLLVFLQH